MLCFKYIQREDKLLLEEEQCVVTFSYGTLDIFCNILRSHLNDSSEQTG